MLKQSASWVKRVTIWVKQRWYGWFALLVVILALVIAFRPGTNEPLIRWTGLILQLLGICTVIWGIEETRRLFNHPTLLESISRYFTQFPPFKERIVEVHLAGASKLPRLKLRGVLTNNPPPSATLEQRVGFIEEKVNNLFMQVAEGSKKIDEAMQAQTVALEQERSERTKQDHTISEKLEATETGGLHISAIGALWLIVGVFLSTAAPELAKCFQN